MAAGGLHISISAEPLFQIAGFPFTNSMLTSLIASGLLIAFAFAVNASFKENAKRPQGIQNFAEWLIEMLYNLVYSVVGSHKKSVAFFPFVASFFLFIVLNNWIGLLPGVGTIGVIHEEEAPHASLPAIVQQAHAETPSFETNLAQESLELEQPEDFVLREPTETHDVEPLEAHEEEGPHKVFVPLFRAGTADLNMTLALAIISQVMAQIIGFQYVGAGYIKKFFNFSSPIMFFVGILEFLGEFTKIISYAFRLFGNIFAGEVLLVVISFLVPVIAPMPFYGLELFVGLIQGLVFAMLTMVFFNMATVNHDEHH